ncbi:MAG: protein kinase [Planctomycetes bacterium]|nr:protein kinase [Planctomycetota bacterium]MBI3845734.1 protein kinase [Planctomycetota bacterium]
MPGLEGRTLGDFRIVREVGRGGMGIVFEAVQVSLQRRVALKVLPPAAGLVAKSVGRFEREASAAARLHHPNIVRVHAVGVEGDFHYIAMEFLEGRTLYDIVADLKGIRTVDRNLSHLEQMARLSQAITRDQPSVPPPDEALTIERASHGTGTGVATRVGGLKSRTATSLARNYLFGVVRIIADVADALHAAHEAGILHRDVKPQNLILTTEGRLVLTDFGLAKGEADVTLTRSGDFVGTPLYMSPEQLKVGKGPVDRRSDVYSLGATLYELLTLRVPYEGDTTEAVVQQIHRGDPPAPRRINSRLPRDIDTITQKAIERDPVRRYQTAKEFADDLRRFLNLEAIHARPQGPWTRLVKRVRRHRGVAAAVAVAVVLGTIAATVGIHAAADRAHANENAAATAYARGRELMDMGKPNDAILQFDEAIGRVPDRCEYWWLRGWARMRKNDTSESVAAASDLEHAVQLDPDSGGLRLLYAAALAKVDAARAKHEQEAAKSLPFRSNEDFYIRGMYEYNEGNLEAAFDWLGKSLDETTGSQKAVYRCTAFLVRAKCLNLRGRSDEAAQEYSKANGVDPRAPEPNFWLSDYWLKQQKLEQAKAYGLSALEHSQAAEFQARCHNNLGVIEFEMGERAKSSSKASDASAHFVEAERHYREAVRLDPTLARAFEGLAVVMKRLGMEDEFRKGLDETLARDPNDVERRFALGYVKLNSADHPDIAGATSDFRRVIAMMPTHDLARLWLAYSISAARCGHYDQLCMADEAELDEGLKHATDVLPKLIDEQRDQMVAHCVVAEISYQKFRLLVRRPDSDRPWRFLGDAITHQMQGVLMADDMRSEVDVLQNKSDLERFRSDLRSALSLALVQ